MDRMASIELALHNERTEMTFYRQEARRSKNPLARAMFENLARDEQEHMTRIQDLHRKLLSEGRWPEDVPIQVGDTDVPKTLQRVARQDGSSGSHDDDDRQAIERAIAFEERGERFYRELSEACENPMEKSFFAFLSGIEREHRLSLVDSLAYLKDPQAWLEQHEKIGLDGA